jgi:mutator protein MutT
MRLTTLGFLRRGDEVLLALKKRKFGVGKWNGPGGKVEDGESVEESILREIQEEIAVKVEKQDLQKHAELTFHFRSYPDWDQLCHVFFIEKWKGEPVETEEMKPEWFPISDIPYEKMWSDDIYWLPKVVAGKYVKASFYFTGEGESLDEHSVQEVEGF